MADKRVEFLPWQQEALADKSFIMLFAGAAGTGKSFVAAHKLHFMAKRYPKSNILMVRKSKSSMVNSTILFYETYVIEGDPTVRHLPSKSRFRYDNGSTVFYGGLMDAKQREQLRSIGADGSIDMIWIEEGNAITEHDYEELIARLRGKNMPYNQVIISTNPAGYNHWINKRLIIGGQAKLYAPDFGINPHNSDAYHKIMNSLTGARHKRMVGGKWVTEEGAVYADFDERIHVVDSVVIPDLWPRYRAIDFGYKNPAVCLWFAMSPSKVLYLYREFYMSMITAEEFAKAIVKYSGDESYRLTIADWDAGDRAELDKHGIATSTAQKDVIAGINQVRQRLVLNDGKPGIILARNALVEVDKRMAGLKKPTSIIEEFPDYHWKGDKEGRNFAEVPVTVDDHGLDALRYLVMELFYSGEVGYGSMGDIIDDDVSIVTNSNEWINQDDWVILDGY